jgi:hypothetical protein
MLFYSAISSDVSSHLRSAVKADIKGHPSAKAAKQCEYTYPFKTVPDFIDFCQKVRLGQL